MSLVGTWKDNTMKWITMHKVRIANGKWFKATTCARSAYLITAVM